MVQLSTQIDSRLKTWEEAVASWKPNSGQPRPELTWFLNVSNIFHNKKTAYISFWGSREITVERYKGSVSIRKLATDALRLVFTPQSSNFLTLQERAAAIGVIAAVKNAYRSSDNDLSQRNLITRVVLFVREWLADKLGAWNPKWGENSVSPRTSLRKTLESDEVNDRLLLLSKNMWEQTFPNKPLPKPIDDSFNAASLAKEPDQNQDKIDHSLWKLQRSRLEETPAYRTTYGEIADAMEAERLRKE